MVEGRLCSGSVAVVVLALAAAAGALLVVPVGPAAACGAAVEPAVGAVDVVAAAAAGSDGDVVAAADGALVAADCDCDADNDVAAAPPAAFSNASRCVRNSISLALIVGSIATEPEVPTAPGVPVAGVAGDSSAAWSPTSAARLACTFAYDARHSVVVVISSLKFAISCDTCVRASPVSCAAAGNCVIWLSESRAAVR